MFSGIKFSVLVCLLLVQCFSVNASVKGYISPSDFEQFASVLSQSLNADSEDVGNIYFHVLGHKLMGKPIKADIIKQNCEKLSKTKNTFGSLSTEQIFYSLKAWSELGCAGKLYQEEAIKLLRETIKNEKAIVSEIRYGIESLKLLGQGIPQPENVVRTIQNKLKEDDSLQALGQAIHSAVLLGGNNLKFASDRVEDIVIQMDEIDGKLLQWEGGLTTTSLLITALLKLPNAKPFTSVQAEKLSNYILTRKTVQTSKGIVALLEAARAIVLSNLSPVSIGIVGKPIVNLDKPDLTIRVSNILGEPLKPIPSPVIATSATRLPDDVVVLSKQPLSAGKGPTEFKLVLKLDPGYYKVALSAGTNTENVFVRVLGTVSLASVEIGLSDIDGSSPARLSKVNYPSKLNQVLQADSSHQLVVKFTLGGSASLVHQSFIRLFSKNKEIVFIAEQDGSKNAYKADINLASELTYSDVFSIELILGDFAMVNPLRWVLGNIDINLGKSESVRGPLKGPKAEIKHLFRQAEKRPPSTVSLVFTLLTAAPLLLLLILWLNIGINFGNFKMISIPFHIGFGSILLLFVCFWLKLNMFATCAWLLPLGTFTFLSGHKVLCQLATSRKADKKD